MSLCSFLFVCLSVFVFVLVCLCFFFLLLFIYFKATQSLHCMLLKLKSSVVIQFSLLHSISGWLRNPSSAFSSVWLWSGTGIILFYLAQPCFQNGPGSVFLLQSHQDRWGKTQPFWSSKHFSIPRAVAASLALLLSQPGEIKDFTGLCVKLINSRTTYIWCFSVQPYMEC